MFLHALMICGVSALTHICWPNSCNNLGDDCCPLLISAAEGMCPCISVSPAQSPAVLHNYFHPLFTLTWQNRELRHRACRLPASCAVQAASPGRARWDKQLARAVSSAVQKSLLEVSDSGGWLMHSKKRKMNRFMEDEKVSLAIQEKTFKCSLSQSTGQMLIMLGSLLNTGA